MDSTSIVDVRTGVLSIIQEYAEVDELFQKWCKGGAGKKAVGQAECQLSLQEGKETIEEKFTKFSLQHGARFDSGDKKSLENIVNIRKRFRDAIGDVLTNPAAEKGGKNVKTYPIALRQASETTAKDTILTMEELSDRILNGNAGLFRVTDPDDILPHMPLRPSQPPRPPGASPNSSQTSLGRPPAESAASSQTSLDRLTGRASFDNPFQGNGSANSSQASLRVPFAPGGAQRNNIYSPASGWKMPKFEDGEDSSTSLVRANSSRSVLNWIFPPKPVRPYHDITPLEPEPAVVPTFKCDEDSYDILQEGEAAVQRLWAAANSTGLDELPRSYPHSAPLIQGPWASIWEDEPDPRPKTPLLFEREATPPTPEEAAPPLLLSRSRSESRPASAQAGKRIRSEPILEFSNPVPRFRRHVSGPSDVRGGNS